MIGSRGSLQFAKALLAFGALAAAAQAQPVLITVPQTVGPEETHITPTAGGAPVPLTTAEITVRGTTLTMNGRHQIASLVVEPSGAIAGVVTHDAGFTWDYSSIGSDIVHGMDLVVNGNIRVEINGRIDVSARGYAGGQGPGAGDQGHRHDGGGGGHGGAGAVGSTGRAGGTTYGNLNAPTTLGSGGGNGANNDPIANTGGRGGGALRLIVAGTLQVDGQILA
ncbi:MAG: hypothetical protein JJU33_07300, partial [Phycisphaerales bacterium]|nr:hypothetical protein [Phycisphaerales bacterium]